MFFSANGQKRRFPLILNLSQASIFALKSLVTVVLTSNIFNRKQDAVSRSKAVVLDSWNMEQAARVTRICTFTLREYLCTCILSLLTYMQRT